MQFDLQSLREAQALAYKTLLAGSATPDGKVAIDPVSPLNISAPAMIIQELPYVNTQNIFTFEFGSRAPDPIIGGGVLELNNRQLGENDIFCIYGLELLIGVGLLATNRVYDSVGVAANDDSIYNSELSMKFASIEPVILFDSRQFRNTNNEEGLSAFMFIRPLRVITGSLSSFTVSLEVPALNGIVLTENSVLSMRLHGAIGVA